MVRQTPGTTQRRGAGFTIVELMVVIAIILLLVAITLPTMERAFETTRRTICASNLRQINMGSIGYSTDYDRVFVPHRAQNISNDLNWPELIKEYADNEEVARCPNLKGIQKDHGVEWSWSFDRNYIGYGYNGFFLGHYWHSHGDPLTGNWSEGTYINARPWERLSRVKRPSTCITFGDSNPKVSSTGNNLGVSLTLWWPYINRFEEKVNSTRHFGAGVVSFVDGHVGVIENPDETVNPMADNTDQFIEYWDPRIRKKP